MRIAFFVGYFPTASETFILNQITGLNDRGHEVDIFAHRVGEGAPHADVAAYKLSERTHYWGLPSGGASRALKAAGLLLSRGWRNPVAVGQSLNWVRYGRLSASGVLPYAALELLRARTYDVIHAHYGPNGLLAAALRELGLLQGELITTFHGYDVTSLILREGPHIYDRLFSQGDLFLPISETWKRRLVELGCPPRRTAVHHMGIDCAKFAYSPRRIQDAGVFRLVSVARLVEKKGIEYGLRAVAGLVRTGRQVHYDIVGDGPLHGELVRLAAELQIQDITHFHGWKRQDEVLDILDHSDVFLAPSVTSPSGDQEGIPVVLMEAMALGMPVVSTLHSGIPELVENGKSGFLVPERDVESLTQALKHVIAKPELWAVMGAAGRAHIEREFNIDKLNDELVRRYERLLGSARVSES